MKSNNIILLVIFFVIAYFLFKKDDFSFLEKIKEQVTSTKPTEENPYKAKDKNWPTDADSTPNVEKTEPKNESNVLTDLLKKIPLPSNQSSTQSSTLPEIWFPKNSNLALVKHDIYVLGYNEKYEQAGWAFYRLKKDYIYGNASRNGIDFMPDKNVPTFSALSSDYSRSGYDRGHLVPAGDFHCCQEYLNETFYMSNISPQNRDFNRFIWNDLENAVRNWAKKYNDIYIITGPVFDSSPKFIGKYNKVAVPKAFYKIIFRKSGDGIRAISFLIPNEANLGKQYSEYVTTIDEIENQTQIDYFSFLPKSAEISLEKVKFRNL